MVYRDYFFDLIILIFKSSITFYLIVYFIYMILFMRKIIKISINILRVTPTNCIHILILLILNDILNISKTKKEKKWYF